MGIWKANPNPFGIFGLGVGVYLVKFSILKPDWALVQEFL